LNKKIKTPELIMAGEKINIVSLSEPLHPLERKYGKEPKIDPKDLWHWH